MELSHNYERGDWIVHSHYGVGEIKATEVKNISGNKNSYFRIETMNSTFWMPVDQMDSEMLRPLATPEDIEAVETVLKDPPVVMSSNAKLRQSRIHTVRLSNTPEEIAELIRDLRARQRTKGILYSSERGAYLTLRQQLVQEWAIVTGQEIDDIESEIDSLLNK